MAHKISILVRADVSRNAIDLLVTGCLTDATSRILATQIIKARELGPVEPMLIDLTEMRYIDSDALEELQAGLADKEDRPGAPVRFALPTTTSTTPPLPAASSESAP